MLQEADLDNKRLAGVQEAAAGLPKAGLGSGLLRLSRGWLTPPSTVSRDFAPKGVEFLYKMGGTCTSSLTNLAQVSWRLCLSFEKHGHWSSLSKAGSGLLEALSGALSGCKRPNNAQVYWKLNELSKGKVGPSKG